MWTRRLRRVVACSLTVIVMLLLPRAATAALTLSPERAVSSPRFGPMAGRQGPAVVVSDGVDFLVVWGDATGRGLYASRVTASGTLARVPDTPVRAGASVRDISATWTGSAYVVTWSDDVAQTVMLATLDRAGNLVAPPAELGTRLRTFPDALAFNGGRGLLAYSDYGLMNVRTALLDTNGTVLRMDVPLPVPPNTPVKLTVGGSGFAAFWRVSSSVLLSPASPPPPLAKVIETYYGVRLNAAGDAVDLPVPLATTEQVTDFGVGSGDGVFALVALERVLIRPAVTQVRLRRFLVDAETMSVRALEPVVTSGWESRILWAGQQFIAYWMDYSPVFFEFRVLPFVSGEATAPQPRVLAGGSDIALSPAIAWNGSRFLATWMDGSGGSISRGGGDVVGMLVESDAASALSAPIVISIGAMSQARPRLARTDSGHLIVWFEQERDDGSGSLFAARLSFTGQILGPSVALDAHNPTNWDIASAGDHALVIWEQPDAAGTAIFAVAIESGTTTAPVRVASGYSAAISSASGTFLVAFSNASDILGVRFGTEGNRLDPAPLTIAKNRGGFTTDVVSNGTEYLVLWTEGSDYWQYPSPRLRDVMAARVTPGGTLLDTEPLAIANGLANEYGATGASDGRDFLVVYSSVGSSRNARRAKLLLREGQLADHTPPDDGFQLAGGEGMVAAAAGATGYTVALETSASGSSGLFLILTDRRGRPFETTLQPIVTGRSSPIWSALSRGPGSSFLLAYGRVVEEAPFNFAHRVFVRAVGETAIRQRAVRR